jgi:hypothetical protein
MPACGLSNLANSAHYFPAECHTEDVFPRTPALLAMLRDRTAFPQWRPKFLFPGKWAVKTASYR